ncbi:hypothetical protein N7493_009800 [Penicillium malachiteum]|uniref:Uncharacterized protein n=1 Tax=Penicillium malachiteum TaxID=1324776 RepID=A0AAD6HEU0_9EURO|nr:hypothetical protein N7493_009800 [Penicillium malachiteum]
MKVKDDEVALSSVYFWSQLNNDEFKLSLLRNLGQPESDHTLRLALRSMIRTSSEEAAAQATNSYSITRKRHSLMNTMIPTVRRPCLQRDPWLLHLASLSRCPKFIETSPVQSFLVEAFFATGKTNTAPIKRAKKPCPANESPFKRRREWESDPTMEEKKGYKRARFAENVYHDRDTPVATSSVRPQLEEVPIPQPDIVEDGEALNSPPPAHSTAQRAPTNARMEKAQQRRKLVLHQTKGQACFQRSQPGKPSQRHFYHRAYESTARAATPSGPRPSIEEDEELSNSIYSTRTNEWEFDWNMRHRP